MSELTHFNRAGEAHMVDISAKPATARRAIARGRIGMRPETLALIRQGGHKKGDVLGVARVAGIMATKRTAELVPMCHPLALTHVAIEFDIDSEAGAIDCVVTCDTRGQTGVEMEALTGVQITLLTIYDMCKAVDRGMCIQDVRVEEKSGGRSGDWRRAEQA